MKRVRVGKSHKTSSQAAQGVICIGYINISLDLTVEILKKLPAKSLVRFQCVSKLWLSIISRRRDFTESILTRSLNQPPRDAHLVYERFLGRSSECRLVLSSSGGGITEKESQLVVPDGMHQFIRGLICCWSLVHFKAAIYNPTTRQSFHLPQPSSVGSGFFGYDALENQYKVLFLPLHSHSMEQACQVFTLGDPTCNQWRTIQGVGFHQPLQGAICLGGVIYYRARTTALTYKLMSFDVRSEEFCHVETPSTLRDYFSYLVNYQGKLGFVCCNTGMEIWVREEDCDERWSKICYYEMEGFNIWRVSGVTRGGEIVLTKTYYDYEDMLGVYYYHPKQNSMRFVDLENTYPWERKRHIYLHIRTLPDHVDNTTWLY